MQVGDCKGYDVWYNMMCDVDVVSYKFGFAGMIKTKYMFDIWVVRCQYTDKEGATDRRLAWYVLVKMTA